MNFSQEYINSIIKKYNTGYAKEHAHRPSLELFFENITGLNVVNDPKRSEYGAPDFIFLKGKIAVAYCEAKDIGVSLNEVEKSEQLERYYGYSNLILTDYLEFRFFRNGQKYGEAIKIAELKNDKILPREENFTLLEDTIKEFISEAKEPIKSGILLAKVMAGKARRIRDNIKEFLKKENDLKNESLLSIYNVIKDLLLAELDHAKFADMYAQTVVYGLFAARYHDYSPETFTRQEARDLVPASNPFLRQFFDHIAGSSFDKRIEFIVNELCEEFNHADVQAIVHDYYKVEKDSSRDPIIHFYEDFLSEYDPQARMSMGVFYTPLPVVRFIVRSIDEILKKDFGLKGLSDSSKIEIVKEVQGKKAKQSVHKVQILDPATGTGTFLNETILHIEQSFKGQEGRWPGYVKNDLLPRLHGFELLMAPYTIAHLKLTTTLKESGVDIGSERLGVFLTNSLVKEERPDINLFNYHLGLEKAISEESKEANRIKNDLPIMVVLGNPPYNVSSQNKGQWIGDLIKDYKENLDEQNYNSLSDDYVKFIRFAHNLIEKNGEGVIGMITNNAYINGITHRQMRKKLLETFDDIYILDLHGNAKKKEKAPDGGKDENVFNIQQGVSIALFVRKGNKKKGLGNVWHSELFGKQESKFEALNKSSISKIKWQKIDYQEPYYFFVPKDFGSGNEYQKGFKINDLFATFGSGIKFRKDNLLIKNNYNERSVEIMLKDINDLDDGSLYAKYDFKDTTDWKLKEKRKLFIIGDIENIKPVQYRPFDIRYTYYPLDRISEIIPRGDSRKTLMKNLFNDNVAFITSRQYGGGEHFICFITKNLQEISSQPYAPYTLFPLYLYEKGTKISNFNKEIYNKIIANIKAKVDPENVLDYIYAVLHSPSYRERYKEFLKIDYPRVPYPKNEKQFFALAKLGEELCHLHLLESPRVNKFITTYPEKGDDLVEKVKFEDEKVFINKTQYFGGVPEAVWNFYIGGYQPAQKWLKDRKGRTLANEDIEHYQKMIVAMGETIRIMKEIEVVGGR